MSVGHRQSMPLEKQGYMKENKMINQHLSIVIPFYNPPYEAFKACLENIRVLDPLEVIVVDDCSTDPVVIALAKQSGFTYFKTPYQSGHDGLPFNIGLQHVKAKTNENVSIPINKYANNSYLISYDFDQYIAIDSKVKLIDM